jgi:hypothetical protein
MAKETTPNTTKNNSNHSEPRPIVDVDRPRGGLMTVWMDLSLGMAEETVKTSFGLLQDVRTEVADRVSATIDFVEGMNQGFIRIGRRLNDRLDRVSNKSLDSGEKAALSPSPPSAAPAAARRRSRPPRAPR